MDRSDDLCKCVCKLLARLTVAQFDTRLIIQEMANAGNVDLVHTIAMAQTSRVAILNYFDCGFIVLFQSYLHIILKQVL